MTLLEKYKYNEKFCYKLHRLYKYYQCAIFDDKICNSYLVLPVTEWAFLQKNTINYSIKCINHRAYLCLFIICVKKIYYHHGEFCLHKSKL